MLMSNRIYCSVAISNKSEAKCHVNKYWFHKQVIEIIVFVAEELGNLFHSQGNKSPFLCRAFQMSGVSETERFGAAGLVRVQLLVEV